MRRPVPPLSCAEGDPSSVALGLALARRTKVQGPHGLVDTAAGCTARSPTSRDGLAHTLPLPAAAVGVTPPPSLETTHVRLSPS
mmetsp:Transcript_18484/g.55745  ORF Transcript_18484/g.55745 Transcript_18484/m.55745 type:complete len:84 (+) Transcript_18484:1471-1722(+)